jgi:N-acetylmuramoyl-L-alanine amidase
MPGMATRTINLIVIHCSATPSGRSIGADPALVIDGWHRERGFRRAPGVKRAPHLRHIGYHGVIDVNGRISEGRHYDEVGAHAAQFNAHSLGVCLVGGAEREGRYTLAQWHALSDYVRMLAMGLSIPLQRARRVGKATAPGYSMVMGVCGHRDLSPDKNGTGLVEPFEWLKTCPGFDVGAWLDNGLRPLPQHVLDGGAA